MNYVIVHVQYKCTPYKYVSARRQLSLLEQFKDTKRLLNPEDASLREKML